jgi:MFS family permease
MSAHAAFHSREFKWFYIARLSNNFGTNIMWPTLEWEIYDITRSPVALGLIGLWVFASVLAATLPAGQAADRLERRGVYRWSQLVLAAVGVLFTALSFKHVAWATPFYVGAAVFGFGKTFSATSAQAWMPHLTPREDLPNAIAWNSSAFQIAGIAGPMIAGFIIATAGEAAAYAVSAACFTGSFVLATVVRTRSRGEDTGAKVLAHLLGGLTYIGRNRLLLSATTMDLFAGLLGGATALLPIFAREILHVGEAGFGAMRSAVAIGAVAAAVALAYRPLKRRVGLWIFVALAAFGASTMVFGLSRFYALSLVALVGVGASRMFGACIRQSLIQLATPDHMRGRVGSINMAFGSASNELSDMESGFTAQLMGAPAATAVGGLAVLGVGALWWRLFPVLRGVDGFQGAVAADAPGVREVVALAVVERAETEATA